MTPHPPDRIVLYSHRGPKRQKVPARIRALRRAAREVIREEVRAGGAPDESRRDIEARALRAITAAGLYRARKPRSGQHEPPGGLFRI